MIERNLPALIPLLFLASALIVPLIGLWKRNAVFAVTLFSFLIVFALSAYGFVFVLENGTVRYFFGGWPPPFGIEYYYDSLAAFVSLVINVVALIVIIHSGKMVNAETEFKKIPFYSIVALLLCGLNGIVLTGDLFNLYVFIEISSLAGYALIAIGEKKAPFAAFRYLIIGTIGASFYLLGIGYLYVMSGTLNMMDMAAMLPGINENPAIIIALTLMVSGIGIKTAIFPMHGWLPDSYTYAPSASSALIAPIGTKVGAYILIRLLFFIFGVEYFSINLPIADILAFLSAGGIIFGSVMAMAQNELKRMLAYSSIAQIGYIGLGIGMANPLGFAGALLHLLNHAFMKACLFLVAGNLRYKLGHSDISKFDDTYRVRFPWTMASFTIAALSMIGLPPMAGFFSKWYLVLATIDNQSWLFLGVILLSSLLNAVYFFRVLEKVYLKSPSAVLASEDSSAVTSNPSVKNEEPSFSLVMPVIVLAAGLIILGLLNAFIVDIIMKMYPGG
ncbi:MAG: monovalent cation/H+ antiporter subunit D family protein [Ignavibacteriaceae bacterium]